jgi:hypothetical protein
MNLKEELKKFDIIGSNVEAFKRHYSYLTSVLSETEQDVMVDYLKQRFDRKIEQLDEELAVIQRAVAASLVEREENHLAEAV